MPNEATKIAFPLRGEWYTETRPADRIPSHGTNRFGLRYAFDFIQRIRMTVHILLIQPTIC
jgi:hypothetical protein